MAERMDKQGILDELHRRTGQQQTQTPHMDKDQILDYLQKRSSGQAELPTYQVKMPPGPTGKDAIKQIAPNLQPQQTAPQTQQQDPKWFQSGAFADGYQFGDVAKTWFGTQKDVRENLYSGVAGAGEKILDFLLAISPYLAGASPWNETAVSAPTVHQQARQQQLESAEDLVSGVVEKDLIDEQKVAQTMDKITGGVGNLALIGQKADDVSVLGEKSDAIVQSLGQMALTKAADGVIPWWMVTGATSLGGEAENALQQGATLDQAVLSGLVSAGAEVLSEKLFGGSGLGEKGLINLDALTSGISNKLWKTIAKYGVDMAAEGAEEVFSSLASRLGSKLYREENIAQLLGSEEALQEYLDSFVSGSVVSGLMNAGDLASSLKGSNTAQQPQRAAKSGETAEDVKAPTETENVAEGQRTAQTVQQTAKGNQQTVSESTADISSVRTQLRASQNELNAMQPVAEVQVSQEFTQLDKAGKLSWIAEKLRPTGYKVERKGFGVINFAKKQISKAFKYFDKGGAEEAAFEALPYVLENGTEISSRDDHKGRNYGTVTIAAPVTINGKRGNMAVVVKQTTDNYYKVHRILTPDGSVFNLSEGTSEAESTIAGESPNNGSLATPKDSASSNSIHQTSQNVNPSRNTDQANNSRPVIRNNEAQEEYQRRLAQWEERQKATGGFGSVGAANYGFSPPSPVDPLIERYGSLPSGENPVRSDELPTSVTGFDRVSQTAVTAKGAKVTPDEFVPLLEQNVAEGGLSYIPIRNSDTVQDAMDYISREGWTQALYNWKANVSAGKAGADLVAQGALLLNNAAHAGNKDLWLDILGTYQLLGTNTAQGLQAMRILKTLEPSDKLYMIRRSVDQMVADMKLDVDIVLDENLMAEYENAQTDAQRDAILEKIQQNVADQIPSTFMDKFTALRYVNMLGNLRTQVRNIAGNIGMKAVSSVKNAVAAGIEEIAYRASGGKFQKTKSFTVSKAQMDAAKADFDGMKNAVMGGGRYADTNAESAEFAQGVQSKRTIFKNDNKAVNAVLKPLEGYRKATNWAMEQGDLIFSKSAYARALAGYLKAQGISETDYSKVDAAVMDDARLYAVKEAQEQTFRDTNWLSGWLAKASRRKDTPKAVKVISEGIMPFRKTPANVLIRAEEYSPLGILNSVYYSVQSVRKGTDVTGAQVVNSWAKSITGTGLFALGMLLQSLGALTTGPDEDEGKEDFESLNGWQNYALVLPDGTNLTIDFLTPAAMPLLMGAELNKLMADGGISLSDLESALTSIGEPMVQMSMLQGVSDALDNVQYAENNLGQFVINSALSYLTQVITNTALGQLERSFESSRQTTYVDKDSDIPAWMQRALGKVSAKTPAVWDYNQIPYINAWGEEDENLPAGWNALYNFLSPSYVEKGKRDPLTQELNRLGDASGENVYPDRAPTYITVEGQRKNLSADEYVAFAKDRGQTQKKLMDQLLAAPGYSSLTDTQKAKAVRKIYEYADRTAKKRAEPDYDEGLAQWIKKAANRGDLIGAIIDWSKE